MSLQLKGKTMRFKSQFLFIPLRNFFLTGFTIIFLSLPAVFAYAEVCPQKLKETIFRDYLKKNKQELSKMLPANQKPRLRDYVYNFEKIDLNHDGEEEYIIEEIKFCDNFLRGASGNGFYYLYQKKKNFWRKIGDLYGNTWMQGNRKTNGYQDILTISHVSAVLCERRHYKWQKKKWKKWKYKEVSITHISTDEMIEMEKVK